MVEDFEAYAQSFVDGLIDGGVKDVVICPGSRSTPLALAFLGRAGEVKPWVLYDERSAAFFALGVAKGSSMPVALVCTSGTAAANFLPAVAEAKLGRVPLVAVTADRPPEARDFGGAQTIDQVKLFGSHAKWFQDVPVASPLESLVRYSRLVGARAAHEAVSVPGGPVHVNFSFREPLISDSPGATSEARSADAIKVVASKAVADGEQIKALAAELRSHQKGIIVAGPGEYDQKLRQGLSALSRALAWPLLPDVLSNLRQDDSLGSTLIRGYESLVRSPGFKSNKPDYVLRLGAVPTSKELGSFCQGARTVLLDDGGGWRDPDFAASTMVFGDLENTISGLNAAVDATPAVGSEWLDSWVRADGEAGQKIESLMDDTPEPFEGKLFYTLSKRLTPQRPLTLVVGSSMPVRDLDYFFLRGSPNLRIVANRGANGIDGVVSTAMGISAREGDAMLVLGDISFYHDMNGLMASKLYELNATIVVVNNRGGGIFSFLAQHSLPRDLFEKLFGEAHDLDFSGVRVLYGGHFARVSDWDSFDKELSIAMTVKGLRVIELMVPDRERNLELHRKAFQSLASIPADQGGVAR